MRIQSFTTPRLNVTAWHNHLRGPGPRAALARDLSLILTPNVLAPLPEPLHLPRGADQIEAWIRAREAESDVYSVTNLGTGLMLGLLILAQEDARTINLGYMLADAAWGKGYATEVIQGLLDAAPSGQGITFVAGVGLRNPASTAVLLKSGFELAEQMSNVETRFYTRVVD